ncbi:MAG: ECF transporter S component [Oscillospiraceae bacterium]|nr:ECF transporter S component [Oscillospiraceae bacterium]
MKLSTRKLVILSLMAALIIIMAFTPIGYLKVPGVSISFLMIPVAIGAIAVGPLAGAILGLVFGITSFVQCFGADLFGTTLMGFSPVGTFIMCIGARVLAGFLAGLVFKALKALNSNVVASLITGFCAAAFNTLCFSGCLLAFFWNNDSFRAKMAEWGFPISSALGFAVAFVGINCVIEAITAAVVTGAIAAALTRAGLIKAEQAA